MSVVQSMSSGMRLTGSQYTENVSNGAHEDTRILEFGGDDTGDQETNYLERTSGAIQKCCVECREGSDK
jgi:hypothetical protein